MEISKTNNLAVNKPESLGDKELYNLCQTYGRNAKIWLQKFAGLLPEVFKRSLHRQHGCSSIREFAKKLSGMNERTVDKILNLHRKLCDKPHLLALFESGEQGWSKLEAIAYVATTENEKDLAEKVKNLPFRALVVYVKNIRGKSTNDYSIFTVNGQIQNNLQIPQVTNQQLFTGAGQAQNNLQIPQVANQQQFTANGHTQNNLQIPQVTGQQFFPTGMAMPRGPDVPPGTSTTNPLSRPTVPSLSSGPDTPPYTTFSFPISASSRQKINILKRDLEKQYKQTLSWNQVIKLWPAHNKKTIIQKVCPTCAQAKIKNNAPRSIPSAIKKLVIARQGQTCSFPGCIQAYAEFHHTKPYALHKNHDPAHIYPVCNAHHALFHAGLIANAEKEPKHWTIRNHAKQTEIDKKAMKFKTPRPFPLPPQYS